MNVNEIDNLTTSKQNEVGKEIEFSNSFNKLLLEFENILRNFNVLRF